MSKFIPFVSVCLTLLGFDGSASQGGEAIQSTQVATTQSKQKALLHSTDFDRGPDTRFADAIVARDFCLSVPKVDFSAIRGAAVPEGATEKLLKKAKLNYQKVKGGILKLEIESKGLSVILILERKAQWKDKEKNDVLYAYIYSEVFSTEKDFKPTEAMLLKIADWNGKMYFGRLGLAKNPDGSYTLSRSGTIFLKNLESEQLFAMVAIAHNETIFFQKEFRKFVENGQ